jgi:hypothetical protein
MPRPEGNKKTKSKKQKNFLFFVFCFFLETTMTDTQQYAISEYPNTDEIYARLKRLINQPIWNFEHFEVVCRFGISLPSRC